MIGAANRGNVTFYCIDVSGLKAVTSNGMTTGLTRTAAGISASQANMASSARSAMAQAGEFDTIDQSMSSPCVV